MVTLKLVPDGGRPPDRTTVADDFAAGPLPIALDLHRATQGSVIAVRESAQFTAWQACHEFFGWAPEADTALAVTRLVTYLSDRSRQPGGAADDIPRRETFGEIVTRLTAPRFQSLRDQTASAAIEQLPLLIELIRWLKRHLSPQDPALADEQDISLMLAGALGCVPALDEFTVAAMRSEGMSRVGLNAQGLREIFSWAHHNEAALSHTHEQLVLAGAYCPHMKLVELHFRRIGIEMLSGASATGTSNARPA